MRTHTRASLSIITLLAAVVAGCSGGATAATGAGGPAATGGTAPTTAVGGATPASVATAPTGGGTAVDACSLLTDAEIESATGFSPIRKGAGPQMGILLSAKDRYDGVTPQGTGVTVENDIEGSTQRFDAGIAFDTEYRFAKIPLAIGVRYYYGLTDTMKGSGPAVYNRVLSGSGRIALGVSKKKPPEPKQ